jgi:hypothetical protein
MNEKRAALMTEQGLKMTEVPKKAKELFDALSEDERKVYQDRYEQQKEAWGQFTATEEGKRFLAEQKAKKAPKIQKVAKASKEMKKATKEARAACPVPRPVVPFWQFMNERRASIVAEHGVTKVSEVGKIAKGLFEKLSAEERKVYEDRYEEQKKAYGEFTASDEGKKFTASLKSLRSDLKEQAATTPQKQGPGGPSGAPKQTPRRAGGRPPATPAKKAKTVESAEVLPTEMVEKADKMGNAESGVAYLSLLRKLFQTPGLSCATVGGEKALAALQKNRGNLNLTRNELRSLASA